MTVHKARPYQDTLINDVFNAWGGGAKAVMAVAPTGSGKSLTLAKTIERSSRPACAIAHRQELVTQLSAALAREGLRHRVVGSEATRRACSQVHSWEFGRSYVDPNASVTVAGVDTLIRLPANDALFRTTPNVVIDEAHHVLAANKWGKAWSMFTHPEKRGLLPTASPRRADGKGLGAHNHGIADVMVEAPGLRWMIEQGYAVDYKLVCPKSTIDLTNVNLSADGDYNRDQLSKAREKSTITGDVVQSYLTFVPGKLALVFDTDIKAASDSAAAYRAAGVPAEVLHGDMLDSERAAVMRRFKARETLVVCSVDLLGEGVDVPAVEAVIFARPTGSLGLFIQQCGRVLRLLIEGALMAQWDAIGQSGRLGAIASSRKPVGYIIDHVGNFLKHRAPDAKRIWSLEPSGGGGGSAEKDDAIPLRACDNPKCNLPYERVLPACPYCGHAPVPAVRGGPEKVDGVLDFVDPATMAMLRGEADRVVSESPALPHGAGPAAMAGAAAAHRARREAQLMLRERMALFGGLQKYLGRSDQEAQARFFHHFKVDVATAQTLGVREATDLYARITNHLQKENVLL